MKNKKQPNKKPHWFERFSSKALKLTGSSGAFFVLHLYGSNKDFNQTQILEGKNTETMHAY